MIEIIARHRGTVDELQGDGMLTFFGAPFATPDDPERAVVCALAYAGPLGIQCAEQRQLNCLNSPWALALTPAKSLSATSVRSNVPNTVL